MSPSPVERAVQLARRRLAGQRLLDRFVRGWAVAFAASLVWLAVEPGGWWVCPSLVLLASAIAIARTIRDYPARLAAALELDARFALKERVTAAVGLGPGQRETPVGRALLADAETHAGGLRVGEKFPLRLARAAWLLPVLGVAIACLMFVWHPFVDSGWFAADATKPDDALSPTPTFPAPKPNASDKSAAERVAALRAELDRLEQQARAGKPSEERKWAADLTAAEDAARALERESLDRLTRMEAQLRQLEPLAKAPDFKDGPGRDAAVSLAAGDLEQAEKALGELAKAAAEKPSDPQLLKQIEQLKDELRKAAENAPAREKLEKLIEQARQDGRDTSGLEQERDRLAAEAAASKPLSDVADKLDGAAEQLRKGDGAEAGKQLGAAGEVVRAVRDHAQAARDTQTQVQRVGRLKADGTGGLSDPRPATSTTPTTPRRDVRVPFVDPKGTTTPTGSGGFGGGFTRTDPTSLGPAIQQAAQSAPAAVAGQPIGRDDRDAVREFFERLGK